MSPVARKHNVVAMYALPGWLRTLDPNLGPLDRHVKSGWIALHTAALRGGNTTGLRARHPFDEDSLKVRIDQYRSLVFDIPRRIGFEDKNLGQGWTRVAMQIGEILATRVREEREKSQKKDAQGKPTANEPPGNVRDELLRVFPGIEFSVSTPFDALRSAYRALHQRRSAKTVRTVELYYLAWISVAAHAILKMRHCDLCFRWAIPGHGHCYEHSQSKEALGSSQEKSRRYRNAVKIAVTYRYPPRPVPKHSTMSAKRLPQIMARLIWHTPLPDEERTLRAIKQEISNRPAVIAQLGGDVLSLKSMKLYTRLEERIDPLEINPSAWVWKIKQLDRWEHERASRCPGRRGKGRRTRWRIVRAISLANEGASKSMIAYLLDVHPSTISNWIRRESFPDLANALKPKKKHARKPSAI